MPRETLRRLLDLDLPTHFIYGNGELAILAQIAGARTGSVTYWGTISGARPPENIVEIYRWTAAQLQSEFEPVLARWPKTLHLEIDGLGQVLFCHSTPRSETEGFTRLTAEDRLLPLFEPLQVSMLVCGHTHMQFDRMIGGTRVVNAGSVGMPFGEQGRVLAFTRTRCSTAPDTLRFLPKPRNAFGARGIPRRRSLPCRAC
jgi:Calcineurin-like phosphoesterase superfamily domain